MRRVCSVGTVRGDADLSSGDGPRCGGCRWCGPTATAATAPTAGTGWASARRATRSPSAATCSATGLSAAGYEIVEPPDLGLDPITAVHDAEFVDFLSRAYPSWVDEGHLVEPGQAEVVPYLFATGPFARRHVAGTAPGDDPRRDSACTRWTR